MHHLLLLQKKKSQLKEQLLQDIHSELLNLNK